MPKLIFITHPEVEIDPEIAVTDWGLNAVGQARARVFSRSPVLSELSSLWCSAERKAIETAEVLAAQRGLPVDVDPALGENDRTATGFLPRDAFEAAADAFFALPEESFRGWETARDAQTRIETAVRARLSERIGGDLAIVSHGAVGTLLWCALRKAPIHRRHDQPSQGHYWCADLSNLRPETGWLSIG